MEHDQEAESRGDTITAETYREGVAKVDEQLAKEMLEGIGEVWETSDLNDYQDKTSDLAVYPPQHGVVYNALGLCGEAGEVANKLKKRLRGDVNAPSDEDIAEELGDALWYLAQSAKTIGYTLQQIAQMNLKKLYNRRDRDKLKGTGDNR